MKVAVVLAGCGVFDGAEIHEAVMTLYAIDKDRRHLSDLCTKCEATSCN